MKLFFCLDVWSTFTCSVKQKTSRLSTATGFRSFHVIFMSGTDEFIRNSKFCITLSRHMFDTQNFVVLPFRRRSLTYFPRVNLDREAYRTSQQMHIIAIVG
jgi:hypothetical protein